MPRWIGQGQWDAVLRTVETLGSLAKFGLKLGQRGHLRGPAAPGGTSRLAQVDALIVRSQRDRPRSAGSHRGDRVRGVRLGDGGPLP